jgi:hypothetical protein
MLIHDNFAVDILEPDITVVASARPKGDSSWDRPQISKGVLDESIRNPRAINTLQKW